MERATNITVAMIGMIATALLLWMPAGCVPQEVPDPRETRGLNMIENTPIDPDAEYVFLLIEELLLDDEGQPIGPVDQADTYGLPIPIEVVAAGVARGFDPCYVRSGIVCPEWQAAGGVSVLLVLALEPNPARENGLVLELTLGGPQGYSAEGRDADGDLELSEN